MENQHMLSLTLKRALCASACAAICIACGDGDDEIACPPLPCDSEVWIHVQNAAGDPVDAFSGTAILDGAVVEVRCPNEPTVTCSTGLFTLDGNPETVVLQLQSDDGELEASVTLHPTYGQPHPGAICQSQCLVGHETVTLE